MSTGNECINFELKIGDKLCTLVVLYRSPSQSQEKIETLIENFDLNLETLFRKNLFLLVVLVILTQNQIFSIVKMILRLRERQ